MPFSWTRTGRSSSAHLFKVDILYTTDWMRGALLRVTPDGASDVLPGLSHPRDPDYSPQSGILGVPEHGNNRVLFVKVDGR